MVYTDGACSNNGLDNAICGVGVYFSERNKNKYNNITFQFGHQDYPTLLSNSGFNKIKFLKENFKNI